MSWGGMTAGTRGIGVLERISRLSPTKFSGLRRASNLGPLDHSKSKYSFSGALPRQVHPATLPATRSFTATSPATGFVFSPSADPTHGRHSSHSHRNPPSPRHSRRAEPTRVLGSFFGIHRWFPARRGPLAVVACAATIGKLLPGRDPTCAAGLKLPETRRLPP